LFRAFLVAFDVVLEVVSVFVEFRGGGPPPEPCRVVGLG